MEVHGSGCPGVVFISRSRAHALRTGITPGLVSIIGSRLAKRLLKTIARTWIRVQSRCLSMMALVYMPLYAGLCFDACGWSMTVTNPGFVAHCKPIGFTSPCSRSVTCQCTQLSATAHSF